MVRLNEISVCASTTVFRSVLLACALLTPAATASAQTVLNPSLVEFSPVDEQFQTLSTGVPALQRYEVQLFTVGATAAFKIIDIGLPTPEVDGMIRYDFASQMGTWPYPGVDGQLYIAAVGPNGSSLSAPSNMFSFPVANVAPTVSVTSPTDGSVFNTKTRVTLAATASDSGGVKYVELYVGTTKVAQDSSSPYQKIWRPTTPGTYTITAVAYDNQGLSTASAPVTVQVR